MSKRIRWFQFSLRGLLAALTGLAIWLGVVVNKVREQREAVMAIEELGGKVRYDWQLETKNLKYSAIGFTNLMTVPAKSAPDGPAWLRRIIGDNFFQDVVEVGAIEKDTDVAKFIPHLLRFRKLRTVNTGKAVSDNSAEQLQAALPHCEILLLY